MVKNGEKFQLVSSFNPKFFKNENKIKDVIFHYQNTNIWFTEKNHELKLGKRKSEKRVPALWAASRKTGGPGPSEKQWGRRAARVSRILQRNTRTPIFSAPKSGHRCSPTTAPWRRMMKRASSPPATAARTSCRHCSSNRVHGRRPTPRRTPHPTPRPRPPHHGCPT